MNKREHKAYTTTSYSTLKSHYVGISKFKKKKKNQWLYKIICAVQYFVKTAEYFVSLTLFPSQACCNDFHLLYSIIDP